jgi:hypothetical protein
MKPQLKDQVFNNVLPGQGYHTSQGVVIKEYGTMVESRLAGEK